MSITFQVRYKDANGKSIADIYENSRQASAAGKTKSKEGAEVNVGEISTNEKGEEFLVSVTPYAGGKPGKKIAKNNMPLADSLPVTVGKTLEETKSEAPVAEVKEKGPKMTALQKLEAKMAADAAKLEAMKSGTYVAPVREKKPVDPNAPVKEKKVREAKPTADRAAVLAAAMNIKEETAAFVVSLNLKAHSNRAKMAVVIFEAPGRSIHAKDLISFLEGKETDATIDQVKQAVNLLNWQAFTNKALWTFISEGAGDATVYTLKAIKAIEFVEAAAE